jgi:hypothetical protein
MYVSVSVVSDVRVEVNASLAVFQCAFLHEEKLVVLQLEYLSIIILPWIGVTLNCFK